MRIRTRLSLWYATVMFVSLLAMAKVGLNPMLNALSALFILATIAFVLFSDYIKKLGR